MWAVASFVSVGCDVRRRHAMMGPFYCVPEMQTEWTVMSDDGWWWVVVVGGGDGWWWWLGSCLANCALLTLSVLVTDALVIPVLVCADSVSVQSVV